MCYCHIVLRFTLLWLSFLEGVAENLVVFIEIYDVKVLDHSFLCGASGYYY